MARNCPYCGTAMDYGVAVDHPRFPTRDHVVPASRGGRWTVTACRQCNNEKGNMPIHGWLGRLRVNGDPRASHVAAFIERHPWSVPAMKFPKPPPAPPGKIIEREPELSTQRHKPWLCVDCGSRFREASDGHAHWRGVHYGQPEPEKPWSPPVPVPEGRVEFDWPESGGSRRWVCRDCGERFRKEGGAVDHWRMVHACEAIQQAAE